MNVFDCYGMCFWTQIQTPAGTARGTFLWLYKKSDSAPDEGKNSDHKKPKTNSSWGRFYCRGIEDKNMNSSKVA